MSRRTAALQRWSSSRLVTHDYVFVLGVGSGVIFITYQFKFDVARTDTSEGASDTASRGWDSLLTTRALSTRRDERHALIPGTCTAEFVVPQSSQETASGVIVSVSFSGLAFELGGTSRTLAAGTCLEGVTVRVGPCVLRGDLMVRNRRPVGDRIEFGYLFYPSLAHLNARTGG